MAVRTEKKSGATPIQPFKVEISDAELEALRARPLIITHGWRGSVIEMLNVVGPLADPTA